MKNLLIVMVIMLLLAGCGSNSDSVENSLEGKYVKLDLFVEESCFMETEYLWIDSIAEMVEEYNLKRDFFFCGVQRETEYSYMGVQVSLYFSNNYEILPSEIMLGDHLIVYGEIIGYSENYWDGYNNCSIVAQYAENNGQ